MDYIHDNSDLLFSNMDTPGFWKEDNLQKKINTSYENDEGPFMLLPPISRFVLSHKSVIIH